MDSSDNALSVIASPALHRVAIHTRIHFLLWIATTS